MNYFRTTDKIMGTGVLLTALSIVSGVLLLLATIIL